MVEQMLDSGFKTVIDGLVEKRNAWLNQLTSGKSILLVTVRSNSKKLYCFYKRHDQRSITVETTKETLDWLFRGKNLVLSGSPQTPEEVTYNFLDVEVKKG